MPYLLVALLALTLGPSGGNGVSVRLVRSGSGRQNGASLAIREAEAHAELPPGWQRAWLEHKKQFAFYQVDAKAHPKVGSETLVRPIGTGWHQQTVHFCSVAFGEKAVKELAMFMQSLADHRENQTFVMHILTEGSANEALRELVSGFKFVPDVRNFAFNLYLDKFKEMRISFNPQYSFIGHVKPFLFERFDDVERCIVHDSDMYFTQRPADLWRLFDEHSEETLMTAAWDGNRWFGDKLNSGMMLQEFGKMRRGDFTKALKLAYRYAAQAIAAKVIGPGNKIVNMTSVYTVWGDQAVYHWGLMALEKLTNASAKPRALNALSRAWNLQMCSDFDGFCRGTLPDGLPPGALHLNCHWSEGTWWKSEVFQVRYRKCFSGMMCEMALRPVAKPGINLHRLYTNWTRP